MTADRGASSDLSNIRLIPQGHLTLPRRLPLRQKLALRKRQVPPRNFQTRIGRRKRSGLTQPGQVPQFQGVVLVDQDQPPATSGLRKKLLIRAGMAPSSLPVRQIGKSDHAFGPARRIGPAVGPKGKTPALGSLELRIGSHGLSGATASARARCQKSGRAPTTPRSADPCARAPLHQGILRNNEPELGRSGSPCRWRG